MAERMDKESEDYSRIVLHRSEANRLKRGEAPSSTLAWMIDSCTSRLFEPLRPNPTVTLLEMQSYQKWKAMYDTHKMTHPLRTRRNTIEIQPLTYSSPEYQITDINQSILQTIQHFLTVYFTGMTFVISPPKEISQAKQLTTRVHSETNRTQLLVDDVLRYLKKHHLPKLYCTVGLTLADLYPGPQWNFALGHAVFVEGVAVCSYGRHFNSSVKPGVSDSYQQWNHIWVILRVLTHEIGHLFGLNHCHFFRCSMNESTSIDEAIDQPMFLCPVCLRKLHKVLGFDVKRRYQSLLDQCRLLSQTVDRMTADEMGDRQDDGHAHDPRKLIGEAVTWLEECLGSLDDTT